MQFKVTEMWDALLASGERKQNIVCCKSQCARNIQLWKAQSDQFATVLQYVKQIGGRKLNNASKLVNLWHDYCVRVQHTITYNSPTIYLWMDWKRLFSYIITQHYFEQVIFLFLYKLIFSYKHEKFIDYPMRSIMG